MMLFIEYLREPSCVVMDKPSQFLNVIGLDKDVYMIYHQAQPKHTNVMLSRDAREYRVKHQKVPDRIKDQIPAYCFLVNMLDGSRTE